MSVLCSLLPCDVLHLSPTITQKLYTTSSSYTNGTGYRYIHTDFADFPIIMALWHIYRRIHSPYNGHDSYIFCNFHDKHVGLRKWHYSQLTLPRMPFLWANIALTQSSRCFKWVYVYIIHMSYHSSPYKNLASIIAWGTKVIWCTAWWILVSAWQSLSQNVQWK